METVRRALCQVVTNTFNSNAPQLIEKSAPARMIFEKEIVAHAKVGRQHSEAGRDEAIHGHEL